ncbi:hypothetical protein NE237_020826 [Protea cynaroides]|uniref:PX domain-containing protein n=1 Tax=Protea cynaroides TaxID=273540 RepID=A0A9Q0K2P4_9MAGN|nr:hypothetical protein NE237_020826 [Protea cynaroides]
MINGEEVQEISSDVPSPDPLDEFLPWVGPKSDAGDASPGLSDCSSCGEPEFERYCSANSVMGKASLCSSLGTCNEFLDSDLGSVKSLGFGEDRVLEIFGFGARFPKNSGDRGRASFGSSDSSSDGKVKSCKEKGNVGISVSAMERSVLPGINKQSKSLPGLEDNSSIGVICLENNVENLTTRNVNDILPKDDCDEDYAEGSMLKGHTDRGLLPGSAEHNPLEEIITVHGDKEMFSNFAIVNASNILQSRENSPSSVSFCGENFIKPGHNDVVQSHGLTSASRVSVDGMEVGKFTVADEETSARYEHSDDESLSVDYGTDDEQSIGLGDRTNLRYYHKGKTDDVNPLLINSAVAFGSDDWDNFEQEAEESSLTAVLLDKTQKRQQEHVETDRNFLSSIPGDDSGSPIFGVSNQLENTEEIHVYSCQVQATNKSTKYLESCSVSKVLTFPDLSMQKAPPGVDLNIIDGTTETELQYINDKQLSRLEDKCEVLKGELLGISDPQPQLVPVSNIAVGQLCYIAKETPQDNVAEDLQNHVKDVFPPMVENDQILLKRIVTDSSAPKDLGEEHVASNEPGENSPSSVASCGDNFTKPGLNDVIQSQESTSASGVSVDGKEVENFTGADEETSIRYENSDDERSSVDYGTDDEQSIGLSDRINIRYSHKGKTDDENPLLINSAVAFGSDDWDKFEQEAEESSLAAVLLDETQVLQLEHVGTEGKILSSTPGTNSGSPFFGVPEQVENVEEILINSCQVQATNKSTEFLESCSVSNVLTLQDLSMQKAPAGIGLNIMGGTAETDLQYIIDKEMSSLNKNEISEGDLLGISEPQLQLDPLSNTAVGQLCSIATETPQDNVGGDLQNDVKNAPPPMVENDKEIFLKRLVTDFSVSKDLSEEHMASNEAENLELNEFYDEVVHEMEEILLDSGESSGARFTKGNRAFQSQPPTPFRDGSLTASTSGTDDAYPLVQQPLKIDGIEVVGAKQKKGEVSLGERLVGVKEYTVYRLRVRSGKDQWDVERRYRDFVSLYRQLKIFFADRGQVLPSPWLDVERESRRIFGNASADVVTQRSALVHDCLKSIRHYGFSFSGSSPLIWFLSPQNSISNSSVFDTLVPHSPSAYGGETSTQVISTLGKTISLMVEVPPHKSMKQLLEAQHYSCAGCHRYFNEGKTLMKEFVGTLGWGKPRLCEYTAQLFCASCHTNDTAILPARVLHFWDFTQYLVSQLAKSYLESIYDQPMLCVSAVNPFLFSKVPTLLHIMGIRKKIGAMLPYVHCPFQRSIYRGLGSRRYLVESNDFFALRDLVDLSKGAFAALPVMVENVSKKISEHITEQCLICCDVGVPCGARQACEDPSAFIFPFQEVVVERCRSCESVFHESCFKKLRSCPCGIDLEVEHQGGPTDTVACKASDEADGPLDLSARKQTSGSTMGFLTGLFSRMGSEKTLGPRDNSTVILMGSLPSNSL